MLDIRNHNRNVILRMQNITKRFPGVLALSGVYFDLYPGEAHLLVGENGAGKSTLIKILSGVYRPDEGDIFVDRKRVTIQKPHQAKELGISTIYQEFALIPHLTVAENVFLGREISASRIPFLIDNRSIDDRCQILMERLKLPLRPRDYVRDLNTAEKQLVEIAKALSTEARILIMDEPTSTLTSKEIARLFDMVIQLKAQGVGIIYISHRLEEANTIGDRVTVLRDGKHIDTLAVKKTGIDHLISLMVGEEISERFPKEKTEKGPEVLKVQNLSKPPSFHDITFSLHKGEIVGLAGLLGSGKEKLLRAICGVEGFSKGLIKIGGKPAKISCCQDAINYGISYLPSDKKEEGIISRMSVGQNITLSSLKNHCSFGILRPKKEKEVAHEFAGRLQIRMPSIRALVEYLSGGNQQKVIIARSLCCRSRIFFFDEPTQGIDVGAKVEIYHLLNELVKQGAAVLLASSELPELMGMCDRIFAMYHGGIIGEYNTREVNQEELLRAIFGKEEQSRGEVPVHSHH
jgi:ribose transport system ATP-binding protein